MTGTKVCVCENTGQYWSMTDRKVMRGRKVCV